MPLFIFPLVHQSISAQSFVKCCEGGEGRREIGNDGHHPDVQSYSGRRQCKYLPEGISKNTRMKECYRIKLALKIAVRTCWKQSLKDPPDLSDWCLLSWPAQENHLRSGLDGATTSLGHSEA